MVEVKPLTVFMTLRLSPDLHQRLADESWRRRMSLSGYVRQLLEATAPASSAGK